MVQGKKSIKHRLLQDVKHNGLRLLDLKTVFWVILFGMDEGMGDFK